MTVKNELRADAQKHPGNVKTTSLPAGARSDMSGKGGDGEIRSVLSRIAIQIADSDRRHNAVLQDVQNRIAVLSERTDAIRTHSPADCAAGFERVEAKMDDLARRLDETAALRSEPDAGEPAVGEPAEDEGFVDDDGNEPECATADEADRDVWPEDDPGNGATIQDRQPEPGQRHDDAFLSIEEALREARAQHGVGETAQPADAGQDDRDDDGDHEIAGLEDDIAPESTMDAGWNDNGDWDEATADALVRSYEEFPSEELSGEGADYSGLSLAGGSLQSVTPEKTSAIHALLDEVLNRLGDLSGGVQVDEALIVLAERLEDLESKIDAALGQRADGDVLGAIEANIGDMLAQIDRISAGTERIDSLEENIAGLMRELKGAGENLPVAIEEALSSMQLAPRNDAGDEAPGAGSAQQFEVFGDMLRSIKAEHRSGVEETSDLLGSIQATMDTLVARVEAIEVSHAVGPEKSRTGSSIVAPVAGSSRDRAVSPPSPSAIAEPVGHGRQVVGDPYADATGGFMQSPGPEPEAIADEIAGYQASQDEEADPVESAEAEKPNLREDFIAAARRAAQAAAIRAEETPEAGELSHFERTRQRRAGFLSFDKTGPRPVLVVAIAALVLAGGGLLYGKLTRHAAAPKATQQPVRPDASRLPAGKANPAGPNGGAKSGAKKRESRVQVPPMPARTYPETRVGDAGQVPVIPEGFVGDIPAGLSITPSTVPDRTRGLGDRAGLSPAALTRTTREPTGEPATGRTGPGRLELVPAGLGPVALRAAAARGEPKAQFEVGLRYAQARGVERNFGEAAKWFSRAAGSGHARSQYRLATLYERGLGVGRDRERARVWYGRAAKQGNVNAMHNLAVISTRSANGAPDYVTAAQWFERAAAYGLRDSQFNLAILYQNGLGVTRSGIEAYKWFALAAAQGDTEAAKRLAQLKETLAPKAVATADRLVANWRAKPIVPETNGGRRASGARPGGGQKSAAATRADIATAQHLLARLGYTVGAADGRLGPRTRKVIRQFEARMGMPASDGGVTPELLRRLHNLAG